MRAYIAGPMTGLPNYNYDAFHAEEERLAAEGYTVLNPARNFDGDQKLPYTTYIRQAIQDVMGADQVRVLPGWQYSRGARAEVHIAHVLGIGIWERVDGGGTFARRVVLTMHGQPAGFPLASDEPVNLKAAPEDTQLVPVKHKPVVMDFAGEVDGGGYKASMDDPKKLPLHLLPPALLVATAEVLGYGANKYAPGNWMRGMAWTEVYSALQRHLLAWFSGEDNDSESNLNHMAHAACCIGFLLHYISEERYSKHDDRVFKVSPQ